MDAFKIWKYITDMLGMEGIRLIGNVYGNTITLHYNPQNNTVKVFENIAGHKMVQEIPVQTIIDLVKEAGAHGKLIEEGGLLLIELMA